MHARKFTVVELLGEPSIARYEWAFGDAPPESRALVALRSARSTRVIVSSCQGNLDEEGRFHAVTSSALAELDASEELRFFTRFCAYETAATWPMPDIVRNYVVTGDADLRALAHLAAWERSGELDGPARLAARVAMYAAQPEVAAFVAREASRLALRIANAHSLDDGVAAVARQEQVLSSSLLGAAMRRRDAHRDRMPTRSIP